MSTAQLRWRDAAMSDICDKSAHGVRSLCYLSPVRLYPGNGSAWAVVVHGYRPKNKNASVYTWGASAPHFFSMTPGINFRGFCGEGLGSTVFAVALLPAAYSFFVIFRVIFRDCT
jgi:hypothetical protein